MLDLDDDENRSSVLALNTHVEPINAANILQQAANSLKSEKQHEDDPDLIFFLNYFSKDRAINRSIVSRALTGDISPQGPQDYNVWWSSAATLLRTHLETFDVTTDEVGSGPDDEATYEVKYKEPRKVFALDVGDAAASKIRKYIEEIKCLIAKNRSIASRAPTGDDYWDF